MQPNNDTQRHFYGPPADRPLQAYKDFIRGMTLALNPDAKDELTEEQWRMRTIRRVRRRTRDVP